MREERARDGRTKYLHDRSSRSKAGKCTNKATPRAVRPGHWDTSKLVNRAIAQGDSARCAKPLSVSDVVRRQERLSKWGNTSSPKKPCASNKSTGNADDDGRCNDVSDDPTNCARTPGSPHRDGGKVCDRTWAWSRGRNASDPGTRCGSYSGVLRERKHRLERSGTAGTAGTTVAVAIL